MLEDIDVTLAALTRCIIQDKITAQTLRYDMLISESSFIFLPITGASAIDAGIHANAHGGSSVLDIEACDRHLKVDLDLAVVEGPNR